MKIITFNIWNHNRDFEKRLELLIDELKGCNADVIALQEVRDQSIAERVANELSLNYFYKKYPFDQEGLAILSKYEIEDTWTSWDESEDIHNSGIQQCIVMIDGLKVSLMNVHLDYEYASNREVEIVKAIQHLKQTDYDISILLGDFNTVENSSIYRFLTGEQSLLTENTWYIDLVESYCVRNKLAMDNTIDFIDNPRWKESVTLEVPKRFDWILLEEPYPAPNPILVDYKLLGKIETNGLTPSDHYGVLIELELVKKG
jgi:endonuclease/exonuclease/phosphatase family metal-dependent hydrolase